MRAAIPGGMGGRWPRWSGLAWTWTRAHWLELTLPPALFLLAAGVVRQAQSAGHGARSASGEQHYRAALAAEARGDGPGALRELRAAAGDAPADPGFRAGLAAGFERLGQRRQALAEMDEALRLMPPTRSTRVAYAGLATGFADLGDFPEAERLLRERVLPGSPELPQGHYLQGLLTYHRDKSDQGLAQAATSFERCLGLAPRHAEARYYYAHCLSRLGRPAEAERNFRQVLKVSPQSSSACYGLAEALRQQGKRAAAEAVLRTFKRLEGGRQRLGYLETKDAARPLRGSELLQLGQLYLQFDHVTRARDALNAYTRSSPADPQGHRALAHAYTRLGRQADAEVEGRLADALQVAGGRAR